MTEDQWYIFPNDWKLTIPEVDDWLVQAGDTLILRSGVAVEFDKLKIRNLGNVLLSTGGWDAEIEMPRRWWQWMVPIVRVVELKGCRFAGGPILRKGVVEYEGKSVLNKQILAESAEWHWRWAWRH